MNRPALLILVILVGLPACATTRGSDRLSIPAADRKETEEALRSVVGSMTGEEVSEAELRRIAREVETDPEARDAVESITGAFDPGEVRIKYCPRDGKRYSADQVLCPTHNVELEWVE